MNRLQKWLTAGIAIAAVVAALVLLPSSPRDASIAELTYSEFKSRIQDDGVAAVTLRGRRVDGRLKQPHAVGAGVTDDRFQVRLPELGDPELLALLERKGVEIVVADESESGWTLWLRGLLPWLLLVGFWYLLWTRVYRNLPGGLGGGGDIRTFLEGPARREEKEGKRVTFADVAGQENAKREVAELVEFLRDPERYRRLGAEVPHGVLMMGPPGTGKTLLARALAGEAGVPYFHISASEFIEVFVGVGASRVRRIFDEAKRRAPSIIFIDELDSIGRVRGTGLGGGHDEREQTLNQILAEMDGFSGHEAVIVLAATNRPDVLDPALLRPGRFDRHVTLELPDRTARVEILQVHTRNIPLANDVNLDEIAAGTPGFSGADIKNLCNEAAMAAARDAKDRVGKQHFDDMRDKILMGTVRTLAIPKDERHRLAVHEAGHTAVAYFLPNTDPLYKVTIIPRGRSLGGTQQLPERERHTLPEEYLHDKLAVVLGGRAAERLLLGTVSSGADEDIRAATQIARAMVSRWGMSAEVGPVDVRESDEHPFLGREIAQPRRFSEATAQAADRAVRKILLAADERAQDAIAGHRAQVERLIRALEEHETLDRSQIEKCLGPRALAVTPGGRP